MKIVRSLLIGILSFWTAFAYAGDVAAVNDKGVFNKAAIKGYDPVAYWTQGEPVKGDKKISYEWRGATWQFSSQEHLELFKSEPEKYAPKYGGYCAWAMADGDGKAVNISPDAWHIHDGGLYLNYNLAVRDEWLQTRDKDIVTADKNYPSLTDVENYKQ